MAKSVPSSAKTAVRFCGSCAVTLCCWAVWIVLSTTLAMLLYVLLASELPIPGFVLRRAEAKLAEANLAITFGRARLDPNGQLLLEDVRLRTKQYAEPILTSELVYVRRSFWSVLAGQPVPDEIRLEGATVQVPAPLSPTGTVEPILRDVALTLRHNNRRWHIDQFTARLSEAVVLAHGEIKLPPRARGVEPLTLNEISTQFLKISRRIAVDIHRLDPFEAPVLHITLSHDEDGGNRADLVFTARGATNPMGQPLQLGPFVAATSLPLDRSAAHLLLINAAVEHVTYRDTYRAEQVRGRLSAEFLRETTTLQPRTALVTMARARAHGESATGTSLHLDLRDWPETQINFSTEIRGEHLAAEISAQLAQKSARIAANGRVSGDLITAVLREITPRAEPYFRFGDPVEFTGQAVIDPGWKFASLRSRVSGGRLDSRGVGITELHGRIDIDGSSFLAHDAVVRLDDNYARGSYWMDFKTTDYRMLLEGHLRPLVIDGWLRGDWWRNFWNTNFDFSAALPHAEIDLQGRWKEPRLTEYFGQAASDAAVVFGADFTQVDTRIFLRPSFIHALALSGQRAGGQQALAGAFKRFTDAETGGTKRVEFNFEGSIDADTYLKLTRGKASVVLDGLKLAHAPRIQATGTLDGIWPAVVPTVTFQGSAGGGLYFYDFPLNTAQVAGSLRGNRLQLDRVNFTTAGGQGQGTATLDGLAQNRRLTFDVSVAGADLPGTIRAATEFQDRRNPAGANPPGQENDFIKRAAGGKLDVTLAATGAPGDLSSFTGTGTTALTGANLGEIQLFGLLSQALSGLSLNFSSLKLDTARSSVRMHQGKLYFPDLKVTGSGAVIEARGDYTFDTSALDFTAKLRPFEENRNILTAAIGLVINPITGIFELKLGGPLQKPTWSVSVGATATKPDVAPQPLAPVGEPLSPPPAPTPPTSEPSPKG